MKPDGITHVRHEFDISSDVPIKIVREIMNREQCILAEVSIGIIDGTMRITHVQECLVKRGGGSGTWEWSFLSIRDSIPDNDLFQTVVTFWLAGSNEQIVS
jgi:hypothetical protein